MNKPKGLSLSALAKKLGRAKSGLHRLAKTGQIPTLPSGGFDPEAVKAALLANVAPTGGRRRAAPEPVPECEQDAAACEHDPPRGPVEAELAIASIRDILRSQGAKADGVIDFNSARTAYEILKVREKQRDMDQAEGRLLDAEWVGATWFKNGRALRDGLTNWPARISPTLAAELGTDSVRLACALDRLVAEFLHEQADAMLVDPISPTNERTPNA